ncbi:MAG: TatD family hydrolase, partial [Patescibacteria group bacterium]
MYIDTHCHLNFGAFKDDSDAVIRRALDAHTEMIIVGAEYKSSKRAVEIALRYDRGVYAAVGLHPVHLQQTEFEEEGTKVITKAESFNRGLYEQLAASAKVVAIGEIGLDYYYLPREMPPQRHPAVPRDISQGEPEKTAEENKKLQQETLLAQLNLAYDLAKPVIIHCREAHEDLLPLLENFCRRHRLANKKPRGVLHCFSCDWRLAWHYFSLGWLIS